MTAVASRASLFGFPCMSQIASVTRGVLRIRLTFHDFPWVIISRRSPSLAAQIAVGLGRPSLVKVVSRTYCALATSAKVGATGPVSSGLVVGGRWHNRTHVRSTCAVARIGGPVGRRVRAASSVNHGRVGGAGGSASRDQARRE